MAWPAVPRIEPMMKEIPLRCPTCGPLVIRVNEGEPRIYRYCPLCGQRALFWSDDAFDLCPLFPSAGQKRPGSCFPGEGV